MTRFELMPREPQNNQFEKARIMLALLESVDRDARQTQRRRASELGIALGLVNAYLKRCIKKGLVKVSEAPARRYGYYLTPKGFAEKSRLSLDYLFYSFSLFRNARTAYANIMNAAQDRGFNRIVLAGVSDLVEIATICALSDGIQIVAIVDPSATQTRFVGLPVLATFDVISGKFDGVVVTELKNTKEIYTDAVGRFGDHRVLAPSFLGVGDRNTRSEPIQ